ncbi:MAG: polysaccharide deacetylase family protein [Lachnospiraceae bacterium]|jgi:peptidoglycan-N-acetylmuramic acid deacetylase|nr:polysaccharide deacetylase family protein [Lachnospiraceae bacterium]
MAGLHRFAVPFIYFKKNFQEWIGMNIIKRYKKTIFVVSLLCAMFFAGRGVGYLTQDLGLPGVNSVGSSRIAASENWGLGGYGDGVKPTGIASAEELKKYDAYFVGEGEEKVIYLTFDAGYENGNTEPILDALKRHQAPATFFVVGHYLESAPELVKRMVEEGHCVGNHTYHHLDMSQISDMASFRKEMDDVANLFRQITGEELSMYYRPPQGKYSVENLKMAKELGYQTFFWSLAYVDWYQDEQPSREEALEKLTGRIHPGAVVLLHSTSKTNGEVLDELLGEWEKMGYSFRPLSDLID